MAPTPELSRRVLIVDYAWPSIEIEREALARVGAEIVVAGPDASDDELVALAHDADAILVNWRTLPVAALEAASRCVVVSRYGVGVDNIPVARATELGIVVTNVPDFCTDELADHTMALLLACARRVVPFANTTRAGGWGLDGAAGMPRLSEQTLGLVGFGRSAQALVPRARGFGMRVVAHTPRLDAARLGSLAGEVEIAASLEQLLGEADYVSLHAPATSETERLIDAAALAAMKPSAYLVNTSRGALVDQEALTRALADGTIAGAALDVLVEEPPAPGTELLGLPNAIVTPHVAFYSETAIRELQSSAAANAASVLGGVAPADVVNREVLTAAALRIAQPPA